LRSTAVGAQYNEEGKLELFMPELPEVETIARGLDRKLKGDVIASIWLGSKPEPLKSSAMEIVETLQSKRIARVRRVGKHIVFDLEKTVVGRGASTAKPEIARARRSKSMPLHDRCRSQWIVHLGMTGRMLVCDPDQEIPRHTHAIARLASGWELRFVDPRRFGRLSVTDGFEAPGFEPLEVALERFVNLFRGRQTPIKSALLNQKLLSGVGNIYADEALFRAGIRPRRRAAALGKESLRRLYLALQEVLKEAIALGGSSVADYVNSSGDQGFFQLGHRVYGREYAPCLVCRTPIKRLVIAGRSSHYCPKCQK
jgi:formamidopyrimidine-DNA glycosylase